MRATSALLLDPQWRLVLEESIVSVSVNYFTFNNIEINKCQDGTLRWGKTKDFKHGHLVGSHCKADGETFLIPYIIYTESYHSCFFFFCTYDLRNNISFASNTDDCLHFHIPLPPGNPCSHQHYTCKDIPTVLLKSSNSFIQLPMQ